MKNMEHVLFNVIPSNFDQVSISGGEPTLSSNLAQILGLIKLSNRFRKVVLTTTGAQLDQRLELIANGIDHLNVSRHDIGYEANAKVFGTSDIITDVALTHSISYMNKRGIDVNLNHVYSTNKILTMEYVREYVRYAKQLGANSISFRYDQNENNLKETYLEALFGDWVRVNEGSCPVCRNHTILFDGMPIVFKASYAEPSLAIQDTYELIYGIDGRLTTDWAGSHEFTEAARDLYVQQFDVAKEHTAAYVGKQTISALDNGKVDPLTSFKNRHTTNTPIPKAKNRIPIQQTKDIGGGCGYAGGRGYASGGGCGR
jgi:organic radical activating enzyme